MKRIIFAIATLALTACSSTGNQQQEDMVRPIQDLAESLDLTIVSPPDLSVAIPPCTLPAPGVYAEQLQYYWASSAGGGQTFTGNSYFVFVHNDGTTSQQGHGPFSPSAFYCDLAKIDPLTCEAVCCSGVASPKAYYYAKGWRQSSGGGSCQRQDPANPTIVYTYTFGQNSWSGYAQ